MANNTLIKIHSKNKKSLKQFKTFLENISKQWKNFTFTIKGAKKKKKKVTVLKSPHVNKKAQTHFQSVIYKSNIKYFSLDNKKNYILLKKIKNHLFPDIKIQINQTIFEKETKLSSNNFFLPKKLYYYQKTKGFFEKQNQRGKLLTFKIRSKEKKIISEKTLQFLKVLDSYGNFN